MCVGELLVLADFRVGMLRGMVLDLKYLIISVKVFIFYFKSLYLCVGYVYVYGIGYII